MVGGTCTGSNTGGFVVDFSNPDHVWKHGMRVGETVTFHEVPLPTGEYEWRNPGDDYTWECVSVIAGDETSSFRSVTFKAI
jgi:hypothetical protein